MTWTDPQPRPDSRRLPEAADLPPEEFTYESLYIAAARHNPEVTFAEYDTAEDSVQLQFLALSGDEVDSLVPLLDANHADIRAEVPNFRAFVAGGDVHTILERPELYTYRVGDVRFVDWLAALAAGDDVGNVRCGECAVPELDGPAEVTATGSGGE